MADDRNGKREDKVVSAIFFKEQETVDGWRSKIMVNLRLTRNCHMVNQDSDRVVIRVTLGYSRL